jgi:hypothetical protein
MGQTFGNMEDSAHPDTGHTYVSRAIDQFNSPSA